MGGRGPIKKFSRRGAGWGRWNRRETGIYVAEFAVDEAKSGALLEGALDHTAGERVLLAPSVIESCHARPRLKPDDKCLECIAPVEHRHLDDALAHVAVGGGGVEAVLAEHVGVELRDGDHGVEVVLERRCEVARAAADAVLKVLFANHWVLRGRGAGEA